MYIATLPNMLGFVNVTTVYQTKLTSQVRALNDTLQIAAIIIIIHI